MTDLLATDSWQLVTRTQAGDMALLAAALLTPDAPELPAEKEEE